MKRVLILLVAIICLLIILPVSSFSTIQKPTDTTAVEEKPADTSNIFINRSQERSFSLTTIFRGLLGMFVLVSLGFLLSKDRKNIPWETVGVGLLFQIILALGVLYIPFPVSPSHVCHFDTEH